MKAKSQLEQSMREEQIRTALKAHGHSSAIGDANAEHDIYDDDAISHYPESGESINLQALRSHHPDKPPGKEQINVEPLAFFSVQAATPEVVPKQDE